MGLNQSKRKSAKRLTLANEANAGYRHTDDSSSLNRSPRDHHRLGGDAKCLTDAVDLDSWTAFSSPMSLSPNCCSRPTTSSLRPPFFLHRHLDRLTESKREQRKSFFTIASVDVSLATGDVSTENVDKKLITVESEEEEEEALMGGGCGRAFIRIIDACTEKRRKDGESKRRSNSSSTVSSCSISLTSNYNILRPSEVTSSTMLARGIRRKIDTKQRKDADTAPIDGGGGRRGGGGGNGQYATTQGALDFLEEDDRYEFSLLEQRSVLSPHEQAPLHYDDKILADIVRMNMIKNNIYIPNYNRSRRHLDASYGRRGKCRRRGGDCHEILEQEKVTSNESQNFKNRIYFLHSSDDDNDTRGRGISTVWHVKNFHNPVGRRYPYTDLRIVHYYRNQNWIQTVSGPIITNSSTAFKSDRLMVAIKPEVMSPYHYWHRHRHREKNRRRAMKRVAEWVDKEQLRTVGETTKRVVFSKDRSVPSQNNMPFCRHRH